MSDIFRDQNSEFSEVSDVYFKYKMIYVVTYLDIFSSPPLSDSSPHLQGLMLPSQWNDYILRFIISSDSLLHKFPERGSKT